jgi:WD40 repeat protein
LKNFRSANQIKKKGQASSVVDTASTFTGIAFYNQTTLLSVESNEEYFLYNTSDIKFWDTRKLLNVDELGLCKSQTIKLNKSRLQKFEEKNFLMSITQYTSFEIRYRELEDKLKLSSKHNSNNNNLFGKGAYPNEKKMNIIEEEAEEKEKNDYIWTDYNNNQQSSKGSNQNKSKKKSECSFDFLVYNKDIEEEKEARCLKEKLKEIKQKKNLKGLTSIFINREQRKILVNSMSNSQYVYDALFFDKTPPIEFKGHRSSFFVKSVLSPCGEFILSGSNDASIYTWSIPQNSVYSISGFHSQEVFNC